MPAQDPYREDDDPPFYIGAPPLRFRIRGGPKPNFLASVQTQLIKLAAVYQNGPLKEGPVAYRYFEHCRKLSALMDDDLIRDMERLASQHPWEMGDVAGSAGKWQELLKHRADWRKPKGPGSLYQIRLDADALAEENGPIVRVGTPVPVIEISSDEDEVPEVVPPPRPRSKATAPRATAKSAMAKARPKTAASKSKPPIAPNRTAATVPVMRPRGNPFARTATAKPVTPVKLEEPDEPIIPRKRTATRKPPPPPRSLSPLTSVSDDTPPAAPTAHTSCSRKRRRSSPDSDEDDDGDTPNPSVKYSAAAFRRFSPQKRYSYLLGQEKTRADRPCKGCVETKCRCFVQVEKMNGKSMPACIRCSAFRRGCSGYRKIQC